MFLKSWVYIFLILIFAIGCNSTEDKDSARMVSPEVQTSGTEYDVRYAEKGKAAIADANIPAPSQGGAFQVSERKIIKTANLRIEIRKYAAWNEEVLKKVQNSGGYVVSSSSEKYDENVMRGNMTIRVPQEKFSELLKSLKSTAKNLENETLGGQDVTEEFYDLTARLDNKRKTEARIQEILKAARSVEDILKVEAELSRVREEIEQMEGRRKFLENQTSYSTISLEWHEPYPLGVSNGQGIWDKIGDGFRNGIEGFGNVLSGVIAFVIGGLPLFVFVFIVIWFALKIMKKRRLKNVNSAEDPLKNAPDL